MTQQNDQLNNSPNKEITLKDLIIQFRIWLTFLLSKWRVILLFAAVGSIGGAIYAFFQVPRYNAAVTFVLEDSKTNSLGAYAGIASQFGIDLGSSSGSGVFSGDNILEFLRSRLMIQKTLLSPITIDSKAESLADAYIRIYNLREKLDKNPRLKGTSFPLGQERKDFSLMQDSLLNIIYTKIYKNNLSVSKPDKKLSFVSVNCQSPDELFSKVFCERLVKEATNFYVSTKTQRSKSNVDKLQATADSIEALLNRKTYSVAASQDMNLNPARSLARVNTEVGTRDKMVLQTMFGEVVKNLELSKMSMAQETPIIQIVDVPILPLKKEKAGLLRYAVIGGFLFGFLTTGWLFLRRLYQNIMA